jgi:hypothetical protein
MREEDDDYEPGWIWGDDDDELEDEDWEMDDEEDEDDKTCWRYIF